MPSVAITLEEYERLALAARDFLLNARAAVEAICSYVESGGAKPWPTALLTMLQSTDDALTEILNIGDEHAEAIEIDPSELGITAEEVGELARRVAARQHEKLPRVDGVNPAEQVRALIQNCADEIIAARTVKS